MATAERRVSSARRGMTLLGKIPAAPKPINLPSQRLENQGLAPHLERGTFSWGSAGRSTSSGCKSASISKNQNDNDNVTKPANILISNNKGESLVEKNDGQLLTESIISPPSSAGNESRGLTKDAKSFTPSTSGPEDIRINSDKVSMLDGEDASMHGHKQASDPQPCLNDGEGKIGDSELPSGPGLSSDAYNAYPPFFMPGMTGMAYAPGAYHQHDGSYGMPNMPYYSGTKGREIVIIHMYGSPGFYGGCYPHPLFPDSYGRPLMYGQYPLQFGQLEHATYPEHGMEDGVSQGTNPPFFREQPEYGQYVHESCSDEWSQGNPVGNDVHFNDVELPAPTSIPCVSKHDMSKKTGRSHWNVRGIRTKPSRDLPLPGRRVTLLTKVSQHEVIINSLHKDSQDTGTESPTTTLVNLPVSPPFQKEVQNDESMDKTLKETSVYGKSVNGHVIPSSTSKVDLVPTGLPEAIMESKVATTCNNLLEKNNTDVPSPVLAAIHTEEHSSGSSKNTHPTIPPGSALDDSCDNTEGKKYRVFVSSEDKNLLMDCVQKHKGASGMAAEKSWPKGIRAEKRNGREHEHKQFTSKPKMGRKTIMPKVQRAVLTKKTNNGDIKASKIQISSSEARPQSTACYNEDLRSIMSVKEACGPVPTVNLSKDTRSGVHNSLDLDLSASSTKDDQDKNIMLKNQKTCSPTDCYEIIASDRLKRCMQKIQNSKCTKQAENSTSNKHLKECGSNSSEHVDERVSKRFQKRNKLKRVYVPKVQKLPKHKNVVLARTHIPEIEECTKEAIFSQAAKEAIFSQAAIIITENLVDNCTKVNVLEKLENTVAITEPEGKGAGLQSCSPVCEVKIFPVGNLYSSNSLDPRAHGKSKNREKNKVKQHKRKEKKTSSVNGCSATKLELSANVITGNGGEQKKVRENVTVITGSHDTNLKPRSTQQHMEDQLKGGYEIRKAEKHDMENAESDNYHKHLVKEVKDGTQHDNHTPSGTLREWKPKDANSSTRKWAAKQALGKANMGREVFIPKIQKDLKQIYASGNTVKACFTDLAPSKSNICPIDVASESGSKMHQLTDVVSEFKSEVCLSDMDSQSISSVKIGCGDNMELALSSLPSACDGFSENIPMKADGMNVCSAAAIATSSENDQWKDPKQESNGVCSRFGKCVKEWKPKRARPRSSSQLCRDNSAQKGH